jgi:hypothetical protein
MPPTPRKPNVTGDKPAEPTTDETTDETAADETEKDENGYSRDKDGNVMNDGDLAISVDATGTVVKDPNRR